jgi:hypothetical protein
VKDFVAGVDQGDEPRSLRSWLIRRKRKLRNFVLLFGSARKKSQLCLSRPVTNPFGASAQG